MHTSYEPLAREDIEQMKASGLSVEIWGRLEATVAALEQAALLLKAMDERLREYRKKEMAGADE